MAIKLSAKSLSLLKGVHKDLIKVVLKAAEICPEDLPFEITEGLRSLSRQKELVKKGFSKTLNSRHLDGHAIDAVPKVDLDGDGKVSSAETYSWPLYYKLAEVFKKAAKLVNVPIEWGGDWKKFKDGPHWQLPFKQYPKSQAVAFMGDLREEYSGETDSQAIGKGLALAGSGVGAGAGVGFNPALDVATQLSSQQYELSSGDIVRMVIAVVIIGLSLWGAYKVAKG